MSRFVPLALSGGLVLLAAVALAPPAAATAQGGTFVTLPGPVQVAAQQTISAGSTVTVQASGVGGIPATGVTDVAVRLTALPPTTGTAADGYLTAYPTGTTRPITANLDYTAGQTIGVLSMVHLNGSGQFSVYSLKAVDMQAEVEGYVVSGTNGAGSYVGESPTQRLLDTRTTGTPLMGGSTMQITVAGSAGVPATGVSSVVVQLTIVAPSSGTSYGGYLTAFGTGSGRPGTSQLSFVPGQIASEMAVVPLGTSGRISVYAGGAPSTEALALIVDVQGYIKTGGTTTDGVLNVPTSSQRLMDTRVGQDTTDLPMKSPVVRTVNVAGLAGVPAHGVDSVLLRVVTVPTTSSTANSGRLITYTTGTGRPAGSTVVWGNPTSFGGSQLVRLSSTGSVTLYFEGAWQTTVDVAIDVVGYVLGTRSETQLGLDPTGATVPDTNYAYPAGAIFMSTTGSDSNPGTKSAAVLTLNKAISLVPEGGTIVVRAGTYRDWYHSTSSPNDAKIATKGFTIQAYPHSAVWFDGSDLQPAANWTSDGSGHWYEPWSTPGFCLDGYYSHAYDAQASNGPCAHPDEYGSTTETYPAAGDPQMEFVDGVQMAEVDTLADAKFGAFYYDWTNHRIYISTDPSAHTVELAARPQALVMGGTASMPYTVRGIGFRRYATNEYENTTEAAVYVGGNQPATFENDVFSQNAAGALHLGTANSSIASSVFAFNGWDGVTLHKNDFGGTDGYSVTGSVFNNNNAEHFDLECAGSCSAAGLKSSFINGYTFKNNIFENGVDSAAGAWCDTDCTNGVFVNNLLVNNGLAGYFYEEDTNGIVASNVFVDNYRGMRIWSSGTEVYNNTVVNSPLINIDITDDTRPEGVSSISLGNNLDYGTAVNDNYFEGGTGTNRSDPAGWFTYFDYNSHYRAANYVLYRVIGAADHSYYSTASLRVDYPSWEAHAGDFVGTTYPVFVDPASGNYVLRTDSAAYHSGGAIPADVASALGVGTGAGQSRGAFSWPSP